ncbi:hypothetical protein ACFPVT_02930 [Corynebacterium choanae]|uniref:Uncharacterized protein n=1 Tax=Corynebacterium choanae TaxID=1862358 RepID=A0A3G6J3G8_9CORY|nr:hypothetical protein [Corynebacterium choanae]AZA12469.1 hypothetical protein CCHOA_00185 [Corynebacterium choanae]
MLPLSATSPATIWLTTVTLSAAHIALATLVNSEEHRYVQSLGGTAASGRALLGRVLVRLLAGKLCDEDPQQVAVDRRCPSCAQPHGAPQLAGISVTATACHEIVAVAMSNQPIGIDSVLPQAFPTPTAAHQWALFETMVKLQQQPDPLLEQWRAQVAAAGLTAALPRLPASTHSPHVASALIDSRSLVTSQHPYAVLLSTDWPPQTPPPVVYHLPGEHLIAAGFSADMKQYVGAAAFLHKAACIPHTPVQVCWQPPSHYWDGAV